MSADHAMLTLRRVIPATCERVFDAWTDAAHLKSWWGPKGVVCSHAEIDARPGGAYRIGNRLPNGDTIWINGTFEEVSRPRLLVFSWNVSAYGGEPSRVTVRFRPVAGHDSTEVEVMHERIATRPLADQHLVGWEGCLDGLVACLERPAAG